MEQPSWAHHSDPKDNHQDQHDHQDDQGIEEILEAEACIGADLGLEQDDWEELVPGA